MFYKILDDELTYGPMVTFADGTLLHIDHLDEVTLPYEGWHYFDTIEEAKEFFGIK